ncbi:MAG: universal stress protein [Chloroflexi bacterium]|jgi:nucleotide-binding universal stress UspA family protein|nr:universal stress protein [Chloroflexota bacterium]
MYRRMLVPLDGSELAEVVFTYAKELAGRLDLDLIFLHVYSPEQSEFASIHRAYVEQAAEIIKRHSEEVQQRTGIQPAGKAVEARGEVAVGHPAEEILHYADENDIDLILMATHGRSGVRRWAMGSVADKVLHASKVPVLLVRAGIPKEIVYDKWPSTTILVPLDGSELAESVLPHVEAVAKQRGAELVDVVLLRVCQTPVIPSNYPQVTYLTQEEAQKETAKYKRRVEQYLAGVEKRLKDVGLKVRSEVLVGEPADEIVDYANQNPFNLIVMATHGVSGFTRWALGSVADRVLLGVSSPIFLVRPVK